MLTIVFIIFEKVNIYIQSNYSLQKAKCELTTQVVLWIQDAWTTMYYFELVKIWIGKLKEFAVIYYCIGFHY